MGPTRRDGTSRFRLYMSTPAAFGTKANRQFRPPLWQAGAAASVTVASQKRDPAAEKEAATSVRFSVAFLTARASLRVVDVPGGGPLCGPGRRCQWPLWGRRKELI
jgi:hypothetical protein